MCNRFGPTSTESTNPPTDSPRPSARRPNRDRPPERRPDRPSSIQGWAGIASRSGVGMPSIWVCSGSTRVTPEGRVGVGAFHLWPGKATCCQGDSPPPRRPPCMPSAHAWGQGWRTSKRPAHADGEPAATLRLRHRASPCDVQSAPRHMLGRAPRDVGAPSLGPAHLLPSQTPHPLPRRAQRMLRGEQVDAGEGLLRVGDDAAACCVSERPSPRASNAQESRKKRCLERGFVGRVHGAWSTLRWWIIVPEGRGMPRNPSDVLGN